jgi:hypothetical protein
MVGLRRKAREERRLPRHSEAGLPFRMDDQPGRFAALQLPGHHLPFIEWIFL